MTLELDLPRRERLITSIQGFFGEHFDEEISAFRAGQILDFVLTAVGPQIYNQAVQDARQYMQEKLADIDGEVYEADGVS